MSNNAKELIHCQVKRIRSKLLSRSRPVQPGCVIRIPFASFSDQIINDKGIQHIYSDVGRELDYCTIITDQSYHVDFNVKDLRLPSNILPLQLSVHDSDMQIVRFSYQNTSLDDPHFDRLFHEIDGGWISCD